MEKIENLTALNTLLDKQQEEVRSLNRKIELLEWEKDYQKCSWMIHDYFDECELPFPRMEMVAQKEYRDWSCVVYTYGLVVKEHGEMRDKLTFFPFSQSRVNSGREATFEELTDLPRRLTIDMKAMAKTLNVPCFLNVPEKEIVKHIPNDLEIEIAHMTKQ